MALSRLFSYPNSDPPKKGKKITGEQGPTPLFSLEICDDGPEPYFS